MLGASFPSLLCAGGTAGKETATEPRDLQKPEETQPLNLLSPRPYLAWETQTPSPSKLGLGSKSLVSRWHQAGAQWEVGREHSRLPQAGVGPLGAMALSTQAFPG